MTLALAQLADDPPMLAETSPEWALLEMWAEADALRQPIRLGACVLVSLASSRARVSLTHEGVVIEVVAPCAWVRTLGVVADPIRSSVERYVVECGTCRYPCRVVRRAVQMAVVCH